MDEPDLTARANSLFVSSNLPPSETEKRLALASGVALVAGFFIIAYIADRRLYPIPGFVLAFSAAMFVCDIIAAILLFAQFVVLRSLGLLIVANGYVLTALILIPYTLTFPGVAGPAPVIGGFQSTAFLYILWHAGFPIFVIAYALLKDVNDPIKLFSRYGAPAAIIVSVALTAALVFSAAWFVSAYEYLLPQTLTPDGLGFTSAMIRIVGSADILSGMCALAILWTRQRSALDLWLTVVLFLYVMDIPLTFYPVPVRFSIGWYSVRAVAFLSSSILVIVLLQEVGALYARLSRAIDAQRREREVRLLTGSTVAAMIAHEVKQPLAAMMTRSENGLRWLDRSNPEIEMAKNNFKEITADCHRTSAVIENIRTNFKMNVERRTSVDANDLIAETLNLVRDDSRRHRVILQGESNERRPKLMGDRVQLQQVLLNLITNAIDAVKTSDGPRVLRVTSDVQNNGAVIVSVADTGTGIRPEDMDRIFYPLFTTKSDGMGMGLSICRSIIEGHGGQISARPNKPAGTIFEFKLPADRAALAGQVEAGLSA